jgi:hypothetical protein
MAPAGVAAQDFSASRNLETLGCGLFGFNAFGTSHKSTAFKKERTPYVTVNTEASVILFVLVQKAQSLAIARLVTYFRDDETSSFWADGAGDAGDFLRRDALSIQVAGRGHEGNPARKSGES